MAIEGNRSSGGSLKWLKHCLLVIATVGLEASVALEVIFMIANIQTLGVPIRYSSLPGTISAAIGMVLIPSMGFIMDKWARSKSAKAFILIATSTLEIMGILLIFTANTIKLIYYDDPETFNVSTTSIWSNTTQAWTTAGSSISLGGNNTSSHSQSSTVYTTTAAVNTTSGPVILRVSDYPHIQTPLKELPHTEEETIRYYAVLAMIGYCLLDCGYDSSSCFVKTFALASTAPKDHSSVIAKSVFVSSFGGCLIAVLGSVGLGGLLTAGTTHDASAAQSACVAALCLVLLLSGVLTTLTTGFCCSLSSQPSFEESPKSSHKSNEKSPILVSDNASQDSAPSSSSRNFLDKSLSGRFTAHAMTTHQSLKPAQREVVDHVVLSSRGGLIGFIIRQKKQILINVFTFFMLGSLYSFEVYAVNFVGDGIFKGNPQAAVGSEPYDNYLRGIEVGSQGTLIYYITFTICTSMHEILLNKVGWKLEVIATGSVYVLVSLLCALTSSLWAYYITSVWTGIYRTVIVTVPYILASKFALEEGSGKDGGVAIAMVAAMLPCGFTVCSALMGPLIDATGNPATPLYYTAVTAFLGILVAVFLKSD